MLIMEKKFQQIRQVYDDFHSEMLSNGRLLVKETDKGYWGITPTTELFEIFQKTNLKNHKNFLDLGSGDGRAPIIAGLFTNAAGVEYDKELHKFAELHVKKISKKTKTKVTLFNQDYMKHQIDNYDYLFIAPDNPISNKLEKKLLKEMKKDAKLVVYGPHYHPKELKKIETLDIQGSLVSVFKK